MKLLSIYLGCLIKFFRISKKVKENKELTPKEKEFKNFIAWMNLNGF